MSEIEKKGKNLELLVQSYTYDIGWLCIGLGNDRLVWHWWWCDI